MGEFVNRAVVVAAAAVIDVLYKFLTLVAKIPFFLSFNRPDRQLDVKSMFAEHSA